MIKKTSSFKDRYKPENLFIRTYGEVVYLPDIDILGQLSLDAESVNNALLLKKKPGAKLVSDSFSSQVTIKVPVPPSPAEGMTNPRDNKRFPLGTKTDPRTGEELKETGPLLQERSVHNQIVYTDQASGTVYYVDGKGNIDNISLGHLSPVSPNTNFCLRVLDTKIEVSSSFKKEDGTRYNWDYSSLEALFYVDPKDPPQEVKAKKDKIKNISNVDLSKKTGIPLFMYAKDNNFRELVHSELTRLEFRFKSGVADVEKELLGVYYAQLIVAVLFADKHSEFFAKQVKEEENTVNINAADAPTVPHIKEDTRFLPHQVYALAFLKEKKNSLVDADPGAGKTLILLTDIIDKLNRGLVKRPCVVMPNSLLSDQKAEFEGWTQNTMNFIVVTTDTVKESDPNARLIERGKNKGLPTGGDKEAGLAALTKLIQEAPPNTILLTSYEWLRGGKKDKNDRYERSAWLASPLHAGVDMLVLDESHRVMANASGDCSNQAEAILQIRSLVPYKRCYTGTVAPGSPDDVFLQMSFLDPSVLGSKLDFRAKYAASMSKVSDKIELWKPGAIKELQKVMSGSVAVSIRRSAWISELPTMKLTYHKATLSATQRVVYERIMNRIIREELGIELDPATGMIKTGNALPGAEGAALQKEMQNKFASNPVAKDQISKWTPSQVISMAEYDPDEGEDVNIEYQVGNDESHAQNFDLSDPEQKKKLKSIQEQQLEEFRKAQAKTAQSWERYEKVQGDVEDAPEIDDFSPLLTKFVAVDKFLNCPTSDDFGKYFLVDEPDRISPKVAVIDTILARHFSDPNNGKVIIFTHYKDVARHISSNIKLASQAVYYDASTPDALAKFKTNDSVQIIVGVEDSIQEGQNLQMANRIIRLDLNWTPGKYEQAIARSYRLPPKDPKDKRYSTLYVDLIFCEGTAELTKFARMVSKMHSVRQLISGYKTNSRFNVVGMTLFNMTNFNTFAKVKKHIEVFQEMRAYEIEESKTAPKVYGTESKSLAVGGEIEGSSKIETPLVSSDLARSPWKVNPSKVKGGVINPTIAYFNGAYWMRMERVPGMKSLLDKFPKMMETDSSLLRIAFNSPQNAFLILSQLRDKGLFVLNQDMLHAKILGNMQCDPEYPQSKIDYGKLVRIATTEAFEFPVLREGDTATKQVLAYNPSQADLKTARELLLKGNQGKEVPDIQVLAAAKILGLYQFDLATLDLKNFWRMTNRFRILSSNRKVLESQLSSLSEPSVAPAKEAFDDDGEIPGLEAEPTPVGIPIQLDIAIFGLLDHGKLVSTPMFIFLKSSLSEAKSGEAEKILKGAGFGAQKDPIRWLLLGETKAQAKTRILEFSRTVYWRYTIGNWEMYLQGLRNLNCTEEEIEEIFPRNEIQAMAKMASLLGSYPEYEDLTRSIYGL